MGSHSRRESMASASDATPSSSDALHDPDPDFPFPNLDAPLDRRHLRLAAYDLFFAACRSGAASHRTKDDTVLTSHSPALPAGAPKPLFAPSRIKTALGLKTRGRPAQLRKAPSSSASSSSSPAVRHKRPRTSAELMRQQMSVPAKNDGRLRLAFTRILLEQRGRRAETIIFPLELLRHLKPSDFTEGDEYHLWQRRQLQILEAGLLLHPAVPLDKAAGPSAARLREIVRAGKLRPIDAGKNSDVIRSLSNCVAALAWRAPGGATAVCHWADGFPLNLHLYLVLLQSIFDKKDDSKVLEEVDELVELIKKTWPTLGIDKDVHNLCFAWVLFQQFVRTGQAEEELLSASLTMLAEVADDAKRADKDPVYAGILSSTLTSMQSWAEKKLLDYHECFPKNVIGSIENVLPLALSAVKILDEGALTGDVGPADSTTGNRVDYYIRSSLRNAFAKVLEAQGSSSATEEEDEEKKGDLMSNSLLQLVKETEELAVREKQKFSPILKRWHPIAEGIAAITLHDCYGVLLKQYLNNVTILSNEVVRVLQAAGKLEKILIQMVEEASDYGESDLMKEMIPYEADSIILDLTKSWTKDRFSKVKDCISRAKEIETWNPTSKIEPYAQSVVELMKLAKETVDEFLKIPAAVLEETVQELANPLESLLLDYIAFVASCGSKSSYIPAIPTLTRCNKDSKITKLWKKASPYSKDQGGAGDCQNPRPSTSRGTQRLYIRLNTIHYLQAHLQYLSKSLSLAPTPPKPPQVVGGLGAGRRRFSNPPPCYFDSARAAIQVANHDVSEVAAYRLIFLDSNCVFYDGLYSGEVANSRVRPALRTMKQNLTLLATILTDTAQPPAIKELAKASFEAFLMVLLAGGPSRSFLRSDSEMISEDFVSLKRMLCTFGEGMVTEAAVSSEVKMVEGIIDLMGQSTEQLVEELSELASEASSLAVDGSNQGLSVPPTTGRWNRSDPNTIFRVLCHRKDDAANRFLKTTFKLAKRR